MADLPYCEQVSQKVLRITSDFRQAYLQTLCQVKFIDKNTRLATTSDDVMERINLANLIIAEAVADSNSSTAALLTD